MLNTSQANHIWIFLSCRNQIILCQWNYSCHEDLTRNILHGPSKVQHVSLWDGWLCIQIWTVYQSSSCNLSLIAWKSICGLSHEMIGICRGLWILKMSDRIISQGLLPRFVGRPHNSLMYQSGLASLTAYWKLVNFNVRTVFFTSRVSGRGNMGCVTRKGP